MKIWDLFRRKHNVEWDNQPTSLSSLRKKQLSLSHQFNISLDNELKTKPNNAGLLYLAKIRWRVANWDRETALAFKDIIKPYPKLFGIFERLVKAKKAYERAGGTYESY